jgi:hypothetical protein
MKLLLTALAAFTLSVCFTTFASAQVVTTTPTPSILVDAQSPWLAKGPSVGSYEYSVLTGSKMSPLSADQGFTYFDPTLGLHPWTTPFQFTLGNGQSALFDGLAEWIHVPNIVIPNKVYVDSIQITFNNVSVAQGGDSVFVFLAPDQLVTIPGLGDFHVMDISGQNEPLFARKAIFVPASVTQTATLTISYPHLTVDPDFHVAVFPHLAVNSSNQIVALSSFTIQGDSEAVRPRLTDNCHSNFYYLNLSTGSAGEGVIDSFFQFGGGKPVYSNFNIKAYVSSAPPMAESASLNSDIPFDVGSAPVGTKDTASLWVMNLGTDPISIKSISTPAQKIFTVKSNTLPVTIAAGDSTKLSVIFAPTNTGLKTSSFVITYSDGSVTPVDLQGQATPALGVAGNASVTSLELYPNPATTALEIKGLSQAATYEIFDVMGRNVQRGTVAPDAHIDLANLVAGRYTISLSSADHTEAHAFLVTR